MPRRVVSTVDWSATDGVGVVVGDVVGVKEGVIVVGGLVGVAEGFLVGMAEGVCICVCVCVCVCEIHINYH